MNIEAVERRKRTVAILNERGVPYRDDLPVLGTTESAKLRSTQEVILRSLCLCAVMAKGFEYPLEWYEELLSDSELRPAFSPDELVFLGNSKPEQSVADSFTWRGESCWTLLWSIGLIDTLEPPTQQFDADVFDDVFVDGWRANAKMRPEVEIFDGLDLIYLYHWAVVGAGVGWAVCEDVLPSVVYERHYALNWLIGYCDQSWDEVTTDT